MNSWIIPSITSLFLYGLWGFIGAKGSQVTNTKTFFVISCIGTLIAGLVVALMISTRFELSAKTVSLSLLNGLTAGFGTLMFIYAMQRGPAIPIVMITALYPMVSILLVALFLNESVTMKQTIGIVFSMIAIYCLTIP